MTQEQIELAIVDLSVRVSQLDGIGLSRPAEAAIPKLQAQVEGLRETLTQVTLTLEAHLNEIENTLRDLRVSLQSHLST